MNKWKMDIWPDLVALSYFCVLSFINIEAMSHCQMILDEVALYGKFLTS